MKNIIIFTFCLIWLSGCSTVQNLYHSEKSFVELEGSMGEPIVLLTEKLNKDDESWTELSSVFLPGILIKGNIEKEINGFSLYITSADFFSNWNNGWTDASYEASGIYLFKIIEGTEDQYICEEIDPFELWDITFGEIRYSDSYYRGNDGIWKVKNRIDRIIELCKWLKETNKFPQLYGDMKDETSYSSAFRDDIGTFLFPESGNFKLKEKNHLLDEQYYQFVYDLSAEDENKGKTVRGAGIVWNMDYTRAILPDEFHKLRNSGTLWRDYEEVPDIFYSLYNMETFFKDMVKNQIFIK